MKLLTVKTSEAFVKDGKVAWKKEDCYAVCASTKSVNNLLDDIRKNSAIVNEYKQPDFYLDEDITSKLLADIVAKNNVPTEFTNACISHLFECLRRGCCFKPEDKKGGDVE